MQLKHALCDIHAYNVKLHFGTLRLPVKIIVSSNSGTLMPSAPAGPLHLMTRPRTVISIEGEASIPFLQKRGRRQRSAFSSLVS
jgi:hypothetical protein